MPIFIATFSEQPVIGLYRNVQIVKAAEANTAKHYLDIEIQDLLENLSEADIVRILQVYGILGCSARTGMSNNELLNQVVVKALSLERRWPRGIEAISFFIETGKSIMSNEEQKRSKLVEMPTIDELSVDNENAPRHTSATANLSHQSAEADVERDQSDKLISIWIMKIQQLFADDSQASCFISQKLDGQKKSKILGVCEFTDQIYRNVEKRIKDKARKHFPNGFPWWELEA